MSIASVLIDGTLVNVDMCGSISVRWCGPPVVHHCVLWATFRASLHVPGSGFALVAEPGSVASGTFATPPPPAGHAALAATTVFDIIVQPCPGPLSWAEKRLVDDIAQRSRIPAAAAAASTSATTSAAAPPPPPPPARCRPRVPATAARSWANWCTRLAAFSDATGPDDKMMSCLVRRRMATSQGHSHRHSHHQHQHHATTMGRGQSHGHTTTASPSTAVPPPPPPPDDYDYDRGGGSGDNGSSNGRPSSLPSPSPSPLTRRLAPSLLSSVPASRAPSATALVFAAASQSAQWRRCCVSFSSVMRLFQRERASFKWAVPHPGGQTVISIK